MQETSQQRLRSLRTLLAFLQQATDELTWLGEKEEIEISRDWSSQNLQLQELEDYFEVTRCFLRCYVWTNVENVKSFPSHEAHRVALISVSSALSQTPAYTARPLIRG